jgi:hypothetical protein
VATSEVFVSGSVLPCTTTPAIVAAAGADRFTVAVWPTCSTIVREPAPLTSTL